MGCHFPIPAARDEISGGIIISPRLGTADTAVPCGTCLGCLADRAAEWAARASHEATLHAENRFVTLTYEDKHLPPDGGLRPEHLSRFWKRLRKSGATLRYIACGEYGEQGGRPHYHAIVFGHKWGDEKKAGKEIMVSEELNHQWRMGECRIGNVTPQSAAYVAKYQLKGRRTNYITPDGEVLQKPFLRMSRKPRIGAGWIEKYAEDIRNGYLVVEGRRQKIPRAYIKQLQQQRAELTEEALWRAAERARNIPLSERTPERLEAEEQIMRANVKRRTL